MNTKMFNSQVELCQYQKDVIQVLVAIEEEVTIAFLKP